MAVFTPVSPIELSHWLSDHQAGSLLTLTPIASGIENTNYFVDTSSGHHVLTLFEKLGPAELPYYLGLMQHLAQQGLPCPKPLPLSHNAHVVTVDTTTHRVYFPLMNINGHPVLRSMEVLPYLQSCSCPPTQKHN